MKPELVYLLLGRRVGVASILMTHLYPPAMPQSTLKLNKYESMQAFFITAQCVW